MKISGLSRTHPRASSASLNTKQEREKERERERNEINLLKKRVGIDFRTREMRKPKEGCPKSGRRKYSSKQHGKITARRTLHYRTLKRQIRGTPRTRRVIHTQGDSVRILNLSTTHRGREYRKSRPRAIDRAAKMTFEHLLEAFICICFISTSRMLNRDASKRLTDGDTWKERERKKGKNSTRGTTAGIAIREVRITEARTCRNSRDN